MGRWCGFVISRFRYIYHVNICKHFQKKEKEKKYKIPSVCLAQIKKLTYFTIQFIFAIIMSLITLFGIIHRSHYTILANFYMYL